MTVNKFKKEIIFRLNKRDIEVNRIIVKGYVDNTVKSIEVSVNGFGGEDVLVAVADALEEIEMIYGIRVDKRLVEF